MACANHPEVPEVARCFSCRKRVCQDCFVTLDGQALCAECKERTVRRVERGEVLDLGGRQPSPWERERSFETLIQTLKAVLLTPSQFFSGLALEAKGYWSYVLAIGWPSMALASLIGMFIPVFSLFGQSRPGFNAVTLALTAGMVVVAPLQLIVAVVIQGAIVHLFLRLVGGANARLETTIRTSAYAQSVLIFNWFPLLGPVVGGVWGLVLQIIGLKHMHGTSYGRVIAAVVLPMTICAGVVILFFVLVFAIGSRWH